MSEETVEHSYRAFDEFGFPSPSNVAQNVRTCLYDGTVALGELFWTVQKCTGCTMILRRKAVRTALWPIGIVVTFQSRYIGPDWG
jgi:hypothetical protein